jgi:hypothetical protein
MRSPKIYLCLASACLAAVLLFDSCKKNDDNASPAPKGTATATITKNANDSTFTFSASHTNVTAAMRKDTLVLAFADDKTGTIIEIGGYPISKTGTYTFQDNVDASYFGILGLDGGMTLDADYVSGIDIDGDDQVDGTGSVTLSTLKNNHAAGTFTMTMYNDNMDKTTVTDGKFDCALSMVP